MRRISEIFAGICAADQGQRVLELSKQSAAMDTVSDGFYTFMEFEWRENTGIICAQEHGGSSYPVLFASVGAARAYAMRVPQGERRKLVAVDDCYWNVLRKYLKQSTGKWCLYLDGDEGILFDVEVYEQVRQMVKKRCF